MIFIYPLGKSLKIHNMKIACTLNGIIMNFGNKTLTVLTELAGKSWLAKTANAPTPAASNIYIATYSTIAARIWTAAYNTF